MPIIKKASIKSYSAATHTATVQVAGSLGVWLSAIRVATNIPADDVVAGRQCTVLFLDPANQDDAVVLTIQGALPSGGGGGGGAPTDATYLTGAAHAGLDAEIVVGATPGGELGGTWAAPTVDSVHSGSAHHPEAHYLADHADGGDYGMAWLTIDTFVQGNLGIGNLPDAFQTLLVQGPGGTVNANRYMIKMTPQALTFSGNNIFTGLGGEGYVIANSPRVCTVYGLNFDVGASGSGSFTMTGVRARVLASTLSGTLSTLRGVWLPLPSIGASAAMTLTVGIDIENWGSTNKYADVYGIRIDDTTANTGFTRLLEIGGTLGTLPNLRLEGRAPSSPGAGKGRSQLLATFNENGTPALRRVEWVDAGAAGGAGIPANAKVLVAV